MTLGEKLIQLREELGWSKMKMAKYLGITQVSYNRAELGITIVRGRKFKSGKVLPQSTLDQLCRLTGKSEDFWEDDVE